MESLKRKIKLFSKERDWEKYHSPKNLAIGLNVEASELLEIFLWLSEEESKNLTEDQIQNVREEIGDVFIYLINLADKLGLDPVECAKQKLELNKMKYPANIVRGSAKKYSDY